MCSHSPKNWQCRGVNCHVFLKAWVYPLKKYDLQIFNCFYDSLISHCNPLWNP
ncbi:hypothetical protein HanRHA438_Chr05g0241691 [Helianthus annuus]|uniref:Uncharacterized protein n=1 Tax=Helianthus annuus TaxID=4232 RepID=A0A251V7M7_HELAN|nr:hypothetical protein HanXRQr2_Chr05g0232451 [Helianthus annuus]KAJ0585836.1 hypothetical protein HanHA89_Chr05g0205201 [Helianthus annuus]KAJ0920470.1 hypothetical protein HanRHA438_Chr05g0241691 [Helianthus annuus]KAJ0924087.1 hypothetical protein HanPSC8_Chr05g0224181 [Helianthus annuus]